MKKLLLTTILALLTAVCAVGQRFFLCVDLTDSITIPNSITVIGSGAFLSCRGFIGSLIIPNSLTTIANRAFYGCEDLTDSITIPNSVASIGVLFLYV